MSRRRANGICGWSLLVLGTGLAVSGADGDWPGWLGPARDGWVGHFTPPAAWPKELEMVWRAEVGTGYGSPLLAGQHVFQHARQGEDEVVWCLDLATGKVEWSQRYEAPFKIGGGGEYHGKGPKSSPALADGRLFTFSISGVLTAWSTSDGQLLWRRDYGERFGKGHPYWGASTSPLIDGDRVIVHFGSDNQGALIALDVRTGEEVWTHGNAGASYASPILIEIDGVRQVVELNMQGLVSVESRSGRRLWEFPFPQVGTDQNMVTPAHRQGLVMVGGENRGLIGLEPRRSGNSWTVQERWRQREVALDMSSAVVNGDLLCGFSHYDKGRIFCLDIGSGKVLWQGPPRTGDNVMFLAIPDHFVALINRGELQVLEARPDAYKLVASYPVSDRATWAPPVLIPGGVLIKDVETLTRWQFPEASRR